MSRNWIALTGLLLLGSVGPSQSHPLDTPDIVYIDGLPCNSACQSYMAWSQQKTSPVVQHPAHVESPRAESAPVLEKPVRRSARSAVPRTAKLRREASKPAIPRIAKQVAPLPLAAIASLQPAAEPGANSAAAPSTVAPAPAADDEAPASTARTVQAQVAAATTLAEQVTAADASPAPQREENSREASVRTGAADPNDADTGATATIDNSDNRVALLMVRQEINSVSDLAGRDVAIEDQQSAASASIRAAIASAGAAEVKLSEGQMKAVDRLVGGEVPAAVVALVSPQAAAWFPDIAGYRIFRVPLSPKARL